VCGVSVLGETAGEHPLNGDECFENCLHDNQRKKLKHFGQSSKKNLLTIWRTRWKSKNYF
jgi:hypothetical protein